VLPLKEIEQFVTTPECVLLLLNTIFKSVKVCGILENVTDAAPPDPIVCLDIRFIVVAI
jgi:hypothetical protein